MIGELRRRPECRWLCGLVLLVCMSGCSDALIYGERTSFNLAISVNDNAALPLSVNAGLQRIVVNFAPPLGGDATSGNATSARGEAVSSISGFDLGYDEAAGSPLDGTLTIRTKFASGEAAVTASGKPAAVAAIVNVRGAPISRGMTSARIASWLHPNGKLDPERRDALQAWMQADKVDPRLNTMPWRQLLTEDVGFEADRARVIARLIDH